MHRGLSATRLFRVSSFDHLCTASALIHQPISDGCRHSFCDTNPQTRIYGYDETIVVVFSSARAADGWSVFLRLRFSLIYCIAISPGKLSTTKSRRVRKLCPVICRGVSCHTLKVHKGGEGHLNVIIFSFFFANSSKNNGFSEIYTPYTLRKFPYKFSP